MVRWTGRFRVELDDIQRMGKARDASGLLNVLKNESIDPWIRVAAAESLGNIGDPMDPRAVEPLLRLLGDRSIPESTRLNTVAVALGKTREGRDRTVPKFIQQLRDSNPDVRAQSARILGYIGDPTAIEPLIQVAVKDKNPHVPTYAELALRRMGELAVETLGRFLENESPATRSQVARILGGFLGCGSEKAAQCLIQALKDERDVGVREEEEKALRNIRKVP
jgi:HEAT repeat protein